MSLLARYRKTGGFSQLVLLIESCEEHKRQEILTLVGQEDPGWAVLVRKKLLTVDKVFGWNDEVILEIVSRMPDRVLALALHILEESRREYVFSILLHIRSRNVREIFNEKLPSQGERHAASIKVLKLVRDLAHEGRVKLGQIDPNLELNDKLVA